METPVGYDEEQAYSWARASIFMGSKLLQNSGIVVINHDGSAFVAQ
jgi:hemin uptake protein HemP